MMLLLVQGDSSGREESSARREAGHSALQRGSPFPPALQDTAPGNTGKGDGVEHLGGLFQSLFCHFLHNPSHIFNPSLHRHEQTSFKLANKGKQKGIAT